MFRYRETKYCCRKYISADYTLLLQKIRQNCIFDWRIIKEVYYEDYICWSYPNIRRHEKLDLIIHQLEFKRDHGLPKNIMLIINTVNKCTYFNKEIRHFMWVMAWTYEIFLYYKRYYRYLGNDRLFGNKNFLSVKNGPKLHFISYLKHRELTGHRLNKGHMVF